MSLGSYNVKMISHIIDDLFDKDFISNLESILTHEIPVTANNVANSHRLFGTNILARSSLIELIIYMIKQQIFLMDLMS